jgi:hypothetical protein
MKMFDLMSEFLQYAEEEVANYCQGDKLVQNS